MMVAEESNEQIEIRRLREQLLEIRSDQIKEILSLVKEHGATLSALSNDMTEIRVRTESLSPMIMRIEVLERFKWQAFAWAGMIGSVAAFVGWMFPRGH
jgi:hypothetical protein